jgi:hypothetical protein
MPAALILWSSPPSPSAASGLGAERLPQAEACRGKTGTNVDGSLTALWHGFGL